MKKLIMNAKLLLLISFKSTINNYILVAIINHNRNVAELFCKQYNNFSEKHKITAVKSGCSINGAISPTVKTYKAKTTLLSLLESVKDKFTVDKYAVGLSF